LYSRKKQPSTDELDKLRMSARDPFSSARDVIIVASVLLYLRSRFAGSYYGMLVMLEKGQHTSREALLRALVDIQYDRSEDLRRGTFRVRGDMIEIYRLTKTMDIDSRCGASRLTRSVKSIR